MWFKDLVESLIKTNSPIDRFFLRIVFVTIIMISGFLIFLLVINLIDGNLFKLIRKIIGV